MRRFLSVCRLSVICLDLTKSREKIISQKVLELGI